MLASKAQALSVTQVTCCADPVANPTVLLGDQLFGMSSCWCHLISHAKKHSDRPSSYDATWSRITALHPHSAGTCDLDVSGIPLSFPPLASVAAPPGKTLPRPAETLQLLRLFLPDAGAQPAS